MIFGRQGGDGGFDDGGGFVRCAAPRKVMGQQGGGYGGALGRRSAGGRLRGRRSFSFGRQAGGGSFDDSGQIAGFLL